MSFISVPYVHILAHCCPLSSLPFNTWLLPAGEAQPRSAHPQVPSHFVPRPARLTTSLNRSLDALLSSPSTTNRIYTHTNSILKVTPQNKKLKGRNLLKRFPEEFLWFTNLYWKEGNPCYLHRVHPAKTGMFWPNNQPKCSHKFLHRGPGSTARLKRVSQPLSFNVRQQHQNWQNRNVIQWLRSFYYSLVLLFWKFCG